MVSRGIASLLLVEREFLIQARAAKDLSLLNNARAVALLGGCKGGFLPGRVIADEDEIIL
jgi:hypothetical protein